MIASAWIDSVQIHRTETRALSKVGGLGSPAPRVESFPRPRRHGAVNLTRYYGPRTIELEGRVVGATVGEAQTELDALKGAFRLGAERVLRFRREGFPEDERVTVTVASELDAPLAGSSRLVRWGVTLLAADPRVYAVALKSASYDPTLAGTGFGLELPLDFPLAFPGVGSNTHLEVENQGNFPTPPVLTVTGPSTNPILENDTTRERITTQNLALLAGETLEIDVAARRVTLAGTTERPDLIDPSATSWWEVVPGVNLLRLNGQGHVQGQTLLTVEFRDARI